MSYSLGRLLEEKAEIFGNKPFLTLVDNSEHLSFSAFNEKVNRLAHGLAACGVCQGSFVGLMLNNSIEFLLCSYAFKKLGAVEVAINPDFRGVSLSRMINLTESPLLITDSNFLEPLAQIGDDLIHLKSLLLIEGVDRLPPELSRLQTRTLADTMSDDISNPGCQVRDEETAYVLFSSGTTGVSKGIMLSHRFAVTNAQGTIEAYDITDKDIVYTPWPLHHFASSVGEVIPTLMTGGQVFLRSRLSISRYWDEVRRYGATWSMMMGGSQKWLWDQTPDLEDRNHKLRFMWGGPFPVNRPKFEERFGLKTFYCYGLSDCGMLSYESAHKTEPPNSCGKIRGHLFDVRIFDDFDNELPIGSVGEIVCRPKIPGVILEGYYGMPEYTLEAFRNLWFHTGDIGRFDDEGRLFFVERKKNVIKYAGENILPSEVEEVLLAQPAVEDGAVIGVPNDDGGEDVVAFVELRKGHKMTEDSLKAFCHRGMARWMVPRRIIILKSIPRTTTGKPALAELRKLLLNIKG